MLNKKDRDLIAKLVQHFEANGVISRKEDSFDGSDTYEVILEEAYKGAKYERELNPKFYNQEVHEELDEGVDLGLNPIVDDYWD